MRVRSLWAKSSRTLSNSLAAGVIVASSLFSASPLLGQRALADHGTGTTHTVCASDCDYTSIQAAIDASNVGDTVDIEAGSYNLTSPVNVTKSLTIKGETGAVITADNITSAFLLTAPNTTVEYLTFNSSVKMTNNGFIGVSASATNAAVISNNFTAFYRFGDGQVTRGVVVSPGVQNITISGNNFNTLRQPAYIDNNVSGIISGNYTEGTKGWVVGADSSLSFSGNVWGTSTTVNGNEKNAVDIAVITNASTVDRYADILTLSAANSGAVIDNQYEGYRTDNFVDATGAFVDTSAASGNGYWTSPYRTIQAGVNTVVPGGKVHVAAGNYTESVTVPKAVSLLGANSGVDGTLASRGSESALTGSFTVNASNVSVDGFTVNGPAGSSAVTMQGSYTNETVTNNVINNNGYAINFSTGSTTISHNRVVHGASAFSGVEANSNLGNNLTFDHNTFSGSNAVSADITVIGMPSLTDSVTVTNNISTSGTSLLALFNSKNVTITGNNYNGDNSSSALYIGGSDSNVSITGNVINKAATAIKVTLYPGAGYVANSNVTAHNNQLGVNNTNGFNVVSGSYNGATVDATNNWWGNASGPTDTDGTDGSVPATNPGGTGATALGAVNYANFCVLADCSTPTQSGGSGSGGSGTTGSSTTTATTTPVSYIVIGGSSSRTRGTSSGSSTTGSTTASDTTSGVGQILGTSTSTGNSGVKGATTKKIADSSNKNSSNFLGLGWWWLLVLAGVLLLLFAARRRSQQNEN